MHESAEHDEAIQSRRVELMLEQLDALPTLSAIAVRVLELTTDSESDVHEVIALIANDPSLASRVLKLCRCSEMGRASNVTTLDRAVLMLGFDTIRSAVLSVQVFELLDGEQSVGGEIRSTQPTFDRALFWQHSLAVAILAERLSPHVRHHERIRPSEAFICGLLHDLGQLCLHLILPKSFDRVCELAVARNTRLDPVCCQTIGMDSHTAGRRLAEHWRLPHRISDVLWLNGQLYDSLPDLEHRSLIALVSLADALARKAHFSILGHNPPGDHLTSLAEPLGITPDELNNALMDLDIDLNARAKSLGLDTKHCQSKLLRSLCRANDVLGRTNLAIRQNAQLARRQAQSLEAITVFHESAAPGGTTVNVLGRVVHSATGVFGEGFYSILYQSRPNEPWQLYQFDGDGRLQHSRIALPANSTPPLDPMTDNLLLARRLTELMPSIGRALAETVDLNTIRLLPLRCGWGVSAVLIHSGVIDAPEDEKLIEALSRTWGAAIAAAAQHEGAKRLGEQLVESNRELIATQDSLSQTKTMAAVGEMAAGAAHEMNNPLTVISGRSQMLVNSLIAPEHRTMASQIAVQSHRLSDIITALRLFANPTEPTPSDVDLHQLISDVAGSIKSTKGRNVQINIRLSQDLPETLWIDPDQIGRALKEIIRNGIESEGSSQIEVRVQINPDDDRLKVLVTDDGSGMVPHTLTHAFDPFFSAKPAGRQPGLGLSQAQRLIEASGGWIRLENGPKRGAIVTVELPHWRPKQSTTRDVA